MNALEELQSDLYTKSRNSVSEVVRDREKREKNCESERLSTVEGVKNRVDRLADFFGQSNRK